jgi:hypothetical protein
MAWSAANVVTSINAQLATQRAQGRVGVVPAQQIAPTDPGAGLSTYLNRQSKDSILSIQDVVQVHATHHAASDLSVSDDEGESWLSYAQIQSAPRWYCTLEVLSNPSGAANVILKWLEPNGAGQVKTSTTSVTQGANAGLTAQAILTALEAITQVVDTSLSVVNGSGAWFSAWIDSTTTGNPSVVVVSNYQHQQFAELTTAWSSPDVLVELEQVVEAEGVLQATVIRDPLHPWTSVINSGSGAQKDYSVGGGTVTANVPRHDVDIQGVLMRPGSGTKTRTGDVHNGVEVIAPGVMRAVRLKLRYQDWSSASGTNLRTIDIPMPFNDWLGEDYYREGAVVITDMFVERATAFQLDTAGTHTGTYPKVHLDVGMSLPELDDEGDHRASEAAFLVDLDVHTSDPLHRDRSAGYWPANVHGGGTQVYVGGTEEGHGHANEWVVWSNTARYPRSGTIPPMICAEQGLWIDKITVELVDPAAFTASGANYVTFKPYVLPPSTDPSEANWLGLGTVVDLTAAPYNLSWANEYQLPAATYNPGDTFTLELGIRLPRGWKFGLKVAETGTGQIEDWGVQLRTAWSPRNRGPLMLNTSQSPMVKPFASAATSLRATLHLPGETAFVDESAVSPAPTYDLADLDQGELYLHVHFWQPRRITSEPAYPHS